MYLREKDNNYNEVPMWKKFLLTVKEASLYFNIGENKMHRIVNDYLDSGYMAKKTVIKRVLKYAPLKTDFQRALSNDETIKTQFAVDMSEVEPETIIDMEEGEDFETVDE